MKKPLVVIFFTVFIYLLGFGMIIPLLPLLSTHYGATPFQAGLLMSCYSLMQFIFSPMWGKISDKIGRRPVLIFCLCGEVISYLILAWARSLEWLFVARILTGFFGASISTASAYVSDVTTAQERSKGMAVIGAAFGLGFVFGPAIGGGLIYLAGKISNDMQLIASFPSYGVALLCSLTALFAFFNLKESLSDEIREKNKNKNHKRFATLFRYFKQPTVGTIMISFAFATLAMAMMESTLVLYMKDLYNWSFREVSLGFAYIGIMLVLTQGFIVRRLMPKLGEKYVLATGLTLMAIGFLGISLAPNLTLIGLSMTSLAIGNGLANPSFLGSVSLLVGSEEQGLAMGTTQSLSSLGRVVGPALGGFLFEVLTKNSAFMMSAFLSALGLFFISRIFKHLPVSGKKVQPT